MEKLMNDYKNIVKNVSSIALPLSGELTEVLPVLFEAKKMDIESLKKLNMNDAKMTGEIKDLADITDELKKTASKILQNSKSPQNRKEEIEKFMLLLEDFVSENKINALKSKDSDKKGILNHTSHLIKASEEFLAQNDTQEQEKMKTNFDTALSLMSLSLVDNHNHTEELNKLKKELKNLMNASKTNVLYNNDNLLQNVERFSKSLKNVTQEIIEKEKTIPMLKVNPSIKLYSFDRSYSMLSEIFFQFSDKY